MSSNGELISIVTVGKFEQDERWVLKEIVRAGNEKIDGERLFVYYASSN